MADEKFQWDWTKIGEYIKIVVYWISIIGPVYSIVKGAIIGTIDEIKKVLEDQKGKTS